MLVLYIFHASCKTPFKLRHFVVSGIRPNQYDSRAKKEKMAVQVLSVPVLFLFITSKIVHFSSEVLSENYL